MSEPRFSVVKALGDELSKVVQRLQEQVNLLQAVAAIAGIFLVWVSANSGTRREVFYTIGVG